MPQQTWWPHESVVAHGDWEFSLLEAGVGDVYFAGDRILRAIEFVARDGNWRNIHFELVRTDVVSATAGLRIEQRLENSRLNANVLVTIEVGPREISVVSELLPTQSFKTNRTGLTVLHYPDEAGNELNVVDADGHITSTQFPSAIMPHQPAKNIQSLRWKPGGNEFTLEFSGDVFEMEDQRNWSDASFKTYNRPLELPFPYVIELGNQQRQQIVLRAPLENLARSVHKGASVADDLRLTQRAVVPSFSVMLGGAWVGERQIPASAQAELAELKGVPRLVELDLATGADHAALLNRLSAKFPLQLRLVGDPADIDFWPLLTNNPAIIDIGVFDRTDHLTSQAGVEAVRSARVPARALAGTRAHFTELNRNREVCDQDADAVVLSSTPLFHAETTQQAVEAIAMQRIIAAQAVDLAKGKPVVIGPVTLSPRFQNVATDAESPVQNYDDNGRPRSVDPRFATHEMATWLVASAISMSVAGIDALCYFADWGAGGLITSEGKPRPVYRAFQTLRELSGRAIESGSTADGLVWGARISSNNGAQILIANVDRHARTIRIKRSDHDSREYSVEAGHWKLITEVGNTPHG